MRRSSDGWPQPLRKAELWLKVTPPDGWRLLATTRVRLTEAQGQRMEGNRVVYTERSRECVILRSKATSQLVAGQFVVHVPALSLWLRTTGVERRGMALVVAVEENLGGRPAGIPAQPAPATANRAVRLFDGTVTVTAGDPD